MQTMPTMPFAPPAGPGGAAGKSSGRKEGSSLFEALLGSRGVRIEGDSPLPTLVEGGGSQTVRGELFTIPVQGENPLAAAEAAEEGEERFLPLETRAGLPPAGGAVSVRGGRSEEKVEPEGSAPASAVTPGDETVPVVSDLLQKKTVDPVSTDASDGAAAEIPSETAIPQLPSQHPLVSSPIAPPLHPGGEGASLAGGPAAPLVEGIVPGKEKTRPVGMAPEATATREGASPPEGRGLMDRSFADLLGPARGGAAGAAPEIRSAPAASQATSAVIAPEAVAVVTSEGARSAAPELPKGMAAEGLPAVSGGSQGTPFLHGPHLGPHIQPDAQVSPSASETLYLPSGQVVSENRILEQVTGRLKIDPQGEGGSMTLKLHPKELGEVTLDLVVEKDHVKAQLIAQNQQVQEVLEKHMPRLRTALEAQGLKLDSLQVTVDHPGGDGGRGFFQEHQRPSAHARIAMPAHLPSGMDVEAPAPSVTRQAGGINLRI